MGVVFDGVAEEYLAATQIHDPATGLLVVFGWKPNILGAWINSAAQDGKVVCRAFRRDAGTWLGGDEQVLHEASGLTIRLPVVARRSDGRFCAYFFSSPSSTNPARVMECRKMTRDGGEWVQIV